MQFLEKLSGADLLDSLLSLTVAFVLGALIGAERQYRQRNAGMRTAVLVSVGSAAFSDIAMRYGGVSDAMRVMANVVTGVGFLGAGVIMKEGINIRGLNSAATVWATAAVGAAAGLDLPVDAILITIFILAGNTLLHPVARTIDRLPLNSRSSEITYEVRVAVVPDAVATVRAALIKALEGASYPVGDVTTAKAVDGAVELIATLVSTAVEPAELDGVIRDLMQLPGVRHAAWESSTADLRGE